MAFVIDGRCLLLAIVVCAMYKSSVCDDQCPTGIQNYVVKEGVTVTFPFPATCTLAVCPSDVVFDIRKDLTDANGVLLTHVKGAYVYDGTKTMTINSASSSSGDNPYATSGIYILTCSFCNIAFKLAVVTSGPNCKCQFSTTPPQVTSFMCSVTFADTAKNEMYPTLSLTLNGKVVLSGTPQPVRPDSLTFTSTIIYYSTGDSLGFVKNFICTGTFSAPPIYPIPNMHQGVPTYSETCDFSNVKCTSS